MYNQDHFIINFNPGLNALNQTAGGRGWLGTVGGGCDYQFNNNFVVGALADYEFMNLKGSFADVDDGLGVDEKEHWAFAVGGRIGFLVTPQILAYVNGGGSWTQFSGVTFLGVNNLPDRASLPGHTFNGGFIGGGTEIAVQSVPGLYWRSEYRFASYRPADLQVFLNGVPIAGSLEHESKNVQTITTSLIWKFH